MFYSFHGKCPRVDPTAFVSTSAELIGDVTVGPRCYIGPGAVIRGDAAEIILEEEVAVEDGVIIHAGGADKRCLLSRRVTIGHGAIVHARYLGPEASIGMREVLSLGCASGAGSPFRRRRSLPASRPSLCARSRRRTARAGRPRRTGMSGSRRRTWIRIISFPLHRGRREHDGLA